MLSRIFQYQQKYPLASNPAFSGTRPVSQANSSGQVPEPSIRQELPGGIGPKRPDPEKSGFLADLHVAAVEKRRYPWLPETEYSLPNGFPTKVRTPSVEF